MLVAVTDALDHERCYRAVAGRDARFDGWFFTAVRTTGIYCRPSCPARTPLARNVSFFTTAAAAQGAGFRACRRCRPDAAPGLARVGRARRRRRPRDAADRRRRGGALRRPRAGRPPRLLRAAAAPAARRRARRRRPRARPGAARADRAAAHRDHRPADGRRRLRGRVRQHPAVQRHRPRGVRDDARPGCGAPVRGATGGAPGWLTLRLAARAPYEAAEVLLFLGAHAVPGLEEWDGTTFSRVLDLPHGPAVVQLSPAPDGGAGVTARLRLTELRDLGAAVTRCRRMLDLDADPAAVDDVLGADPALAPLVAGAPGRRVPASPDAAELAVRAVLGQQVSVAGARTLTARVVHGRGHSPGRAGRHAHPRLPAARRRSPRPTSTAVGLTGARRRTVHALAAALADGDDRPRPGRRPRGGRPRAARRPRHRPVDGGARRAARSGRPRRLAARRPRPADVARRPRQLRRRRRHPLAAVAVLRRPAPVGARRALPLHPPGHAPHPPASP